MKTSFLKLTSLAILGTLGMGALISTPVLAETEVETTCSQCANGLIDEAICAASGCKKADGSAYGSVNSFEDTVAIILNGIIAALGIVAVIYVIIGGINYMTSAGDTGKLEKAKKTILYACIGLVICVLAFAIVNWVVVGVLKNS